MASRLNPIPSGSLRLAARALAIVACPLLMGASGCLGFLRNDEPNLSPIRQQLSQQQLIDHINANSSRVASWRCTDAKIIVRPSKIIPMPITLSALIAVERDQRFRLRAESILGDEADIGSNDERFWFWMRRSKQRYVFTARHDQLDTVGERMRIPMQPQWIMEALGVHPIDPASVIRQKQGPDPQTIILVTESVSPAGRRTHREILVNTKWGIVTEHRFFDDSRRLIARATFSDHRKEPGGAVLAHRIELDCPSTQMKMSVELTEIDVNPSNLSSAMWELPSIPNFPRFEMGRRLGSPRGATSSPRVATRGLEATRVNQLGPKVVYLPPRHRKPLEAPPFQKSSQGWNAPPAMDEPPWAAGEFQSNTAVRPPPF